MPYITASIIIQLLAVVIPSLEKMQKEGEAGQRADHAVHALPDRRARGRPVGRLRGPVPQRLGPRAARTRCPNLNARVFILIVRPLTAGSTLLMWMGELITRRGVGNGQSLLIFCSILTSIPTAISAWLNGGVFEKLSLPIVVLGVILAVVFINEGQRRIPIQYARASRRDRRRPDDLHAAARQHGRRHPGHLRRRRAAASAHASGS